MEADDQTNKSNANGDGEKNRGKSSSDNNSTSSQDDIQRVSMQVNSQTSAETKKNNTNKQRFRRKKILLTQNERRQAKQNDVAIGSFDNSSTTLSSLDTMTIPTSISGTIALNDNNVARKGKNSTRHLATGKRVAQSFPSVARRQAATDDREPTFSERKRQIASRSTGKRQKNKNEKNTRQLQLARANFSNTEQDTTRQTSVLEEENQTPGAYHTYPSGTPRPLEEEHAESSIFYSTSNNDISLNDNDEGLNLPGESNATQSGTSEDYLIEAVLVQESPLIRQGPQVQASNSEDEYTASVDSNIVTARKESWWRRINPLWFILANLFLVAVLGIIVYFTVFFGRSPPSATTFMPTFAPTSPPTRMLAIQFMQRSIVNEIDNMQKRAFDTPGDSITVKLSTETSMAFQDEESPQSRAVEWVVDNTVLPNIDMIIQNKTKQQASLVGNNGTVSSAQMDEGFLLQDNATIVVIETNSAPIVQSLMQQFAMVTLYLSTGGDEGYWINDSGWLSSTSGNNSTSIFDNVECDWFLGFDVACEEMVVRDNDDTVTLRAVTRIVLPDNNITGNFPNEIGLLSPTLLELDISNSLAGQNSLTGTLPVMLSLLSRLQRVSIANHEGLFRRDLFLLEQDVFGFFKTPLELVYLNFSNTNRVGDFPLGVTRDLPRLEVFDVSHNGIGSSLPTDINNLSRLRIFDLSENVLTSTVPVNIDSLRFLQVLDLADNRFTGDINVFFSPRLSSLKVLNLYGNDFSGTISSDLVDLVPSLEALNLGGNGLSRGTLPAKVGLLTKLTSLECHDINLEGPLPSELLGLTQLVTLDLTSNFLTGNLPTSLLFGGTFTDLTTVRLGDNEFEGAGFLSSPNISLAASGKTRPLPIQYLDLSMNKFRGFLGGDLFALFQSTLTTLKLYDCALSGEIPAELGLATKLERLELFSNTFEGTIPSEIVNLKSLRILDLSANVLVGRLPDVFQRVASLEHVNLNHNLLNGSLTAGTLRNLVNLTSMSIRSNEITGRLPDMVKLSNLEHIDFGGIQLSGTFPSAISRLTRLTSLLLDFNQFSGSIPSEIGHMGALRQFDVSSNNLNATFPSEIGLLSQLTSLDVSRNLLSGMLPLELINLDSLRSFRINSNELSGSIPTQICGFQVRSFSVVDCDMVQCDCCGCPEPTPAPLVPGPTGIPTMSPSAFQTFVPSTQIQAPPAPIGVNLLCVVGLQIDCIDCVNIRENLPFRPECVDTPFGMQFRFSGGGCYASFNIQPPILFECNDIVVGGPSLTEPSFIVVQDVRTGTIYHENFVAPGSDYALAVPDRGRIGSSLNITVYSSSRVAFDTQLQTVVLDTSCARNNLFLGDQFGSHQLIGFQNEEQENVSVFKHLTFAVTVENLGESTFSLVSLSSIGSNGFTNLTDVVKGTVLTSAERAVFEFSDVLDTANTTSTTYSQLTNSIAMTSGGTRCESTQFFTLLLGG